jgi:hypothetical protein
MTTCARIRGARLPAVSLTAALTPEDKTPSAAVRRTDRPHRLWRLGVAAATGIALAVIGFTLTAPAANASPAPSCHSRGISFTNVLNVGECIKDSTNSFELVMQGDGNLVEYFVRAKAGSACWASSWGNRGMHAGNKAYFWTRTLTLMKASHLSVAPSSTSSSMTYFVTDVTYADNSTNVSINQFGEVFVGYTNITLNTAHYNECVR